MRTRFASTITKGAAILVLLSTLDAQLSALLAQGMTAFTYQGQLYDGGQPANGSYDFTFQLLDGSLGGGPTNVQAGVFVTNGLFTTLLDFGSSAFTGDARAVQISLRRSGQGALLTLWPPNRITPVPYALAAGSVATGGLAAGAYGNAVSFSNPSNVFAGSFSGDGAGLMGVDALTIRGLSPVNFWQTTGNAGTSPANGNFLGTTDDAPLELQVNNQRALRLEPDDSGQNEPNVIGGSMMNFVPTGTKGATIAGGGFGQPLPYVSSPNSVQADLGAVGGGNGNWIWPGAQNATIGGGEGNTIEANAVYSVIGGGRGNTAGGRGAFVGGGGFDGSTAVGNMAGGDASAVGGGVGNQATNSWATVAGGANNVAGGSWATVGGGGSNLATNINATVAGGRGNIAGGNFGTVGGGEGNTASAWSTVAGGSQNTSGNAVFTGAGWFNAFAAVGGGQGNTATGSFSTIPGGLNNTASGDSSFAAGTGAAATDHGAFVWSDGNIGTTPVSSQGASSFTAQATGGFYFYTVSSTEIGGPAGAQLTSTSWSSLSDRNAKKNIEPVDYQAVLEKLARVSVEQWNYKWEKDSEVPHLGPMAQDFIGAFYPGRDDKHITTLEFDGVELAAIQGLNLRLTAELQQKETEITELKQRNDSLEERLEALDRIVLQQRHN